MPPPATASLTHRFRASWPLRPGRSILAALARRRDWQALARLDPHLLRDIGLTPAAARAECAKPCWRI